MHPAVGQDLSDAVARPTTTFWSHFFFSTEFLISVPVLGLKMGIFIIQLLVTASCCHATGSMALIHQWLLSYGSLVADSFMITVEIHFWMCCWSRWLPAIITQQPVTNTWNIPNVKNQNKTNRWFIFDSKQFIRCSIMHDKYLWPLFKVDSI